MRRLLILNVLLLVIVAALVVQIAAVWWRAEADVEQVAPREVKSQRQELVPVARRPPPPDLVASIPNKDLFDQSRALAPQAPVPTAAGPDVARPLTLVLLGVVGAGSERQALVRDQAQPKPIWLRQGEEVGGYKLGRIDASAITMVAPNGDEVTLVINVEKGRAPAVAMGPAGIQPTPAAVATRTRPGAVVTPVMAHTPAADIKERIERLRQEARRRRGQPEK